MCVHCEKLSGKVWEYVGEEQVGELVNANPASSVRIQKDGTTEEAVDRVC